MDETLRGYWNYCGLNLLFLSQLWEESIEDMLFTYGIKLRELMLLRLIASNNFIRQKDLAVYVGRCNETVNKLMASLEEKDFIIRRKIRHCGKEKKLADITDAGTYILFITEPVLQKQEELFMGHLPMATRLGVNSTLKNLLEKKLVN